MRLIALLALLLLFSCKKDLPEVSWINSKLMGHTLYPEFAENPPISFDNEKICMDKSCFKIEETYRGDTHRLLNAFVSYVGSSSQDVYRCNVYNYDSQGPDAFIISIYIENPEEDLIHIFTDEYHL